MIWGKYTSDLSPNWTVDTNVMLRGWHGIPPITEYKQPTSAMTSSFHKNLLYQRFCLLKHSNEVDREIKNYLQLIVKSCFCHFSSLKLFSKIRAYRRLQRIWIQQFQPPVEHLDKYVLSHHWIRTSSNSAIWLLQNCITCWRHTQARPTNWAGKFSSPLRDSRRVVALSAAGANATSTRSGAGAKLCPGTPAPVVSLRLLAGSPDAVALKAPLQWRATGKDRSDR